MLIVITTGEHRYTHARLEAQIRGLDVKVVTWDEVWDGYKGQDAAYILTDFDRLAAWRLRFASAFYQTLRSEGRRVLNNPARVLSRAGLSRKLRQIGVNDFDTIRFEEFRNPTRWPVFLRTEGDHHKPISGLLHNLKEMRLGIAKCIEQGYPASTILIVEFCAEEVCPGLYRKLSIFRVGDAVLGYTCVHDDQWLVKYGKPGIATDQLYQQELQMVRKTPFAQEAAGIFGLAGIEYGRMDFGLVGGRMQVYEINTNPDINLFPKPSHSDVRNKSLEVFRGRYVRALRQLVR